MHPDEIGYDRKAITRLIEGDRSQYKVETRFIHVTGAPIWVAVQATMINDSGPRRAPVPRAGAGRHPSPPLRGEPAVPRHARPAHGLHNRSSFATQLETHADLVRRYGDGGALLLLDLDHFKYVNDTLGHQAGDHVIARVAKVLAARLRESDVLARLGGDEFAVLLPKADVAAGQRVAHDLLAALRAERITVPGTSDRTITASIGIAMFERGEGLSGEDVLVSADLAMYDAKEAGRNQLVVHSADEHAQVRMQGRVTWAQRIRVAIDEGRFTLVAQPILDLETGIVTQFEVLLRMLDDDGDMIPPSAFLSTAERLGMIQEIDAIVVTRERSERSPPRATRSLRPGSRSTCRAARWATRRSCGSSSASCTRRAWTRRA